MHKITPLQRSIDESASLLVKQREKYDSIRDFCYAFIIACVYLFFVLALTYFDVI